jgi:hypothetical protein
MQRKWLLTVNFGRKIAAKQSVQFYKYFIFKITHLDYKIHQNKNTNRI